MNDQLRDTQGRFMTTNRTKRLSIRLTPTEQAMIRQLAKVADRSITDFIIELVKYQACFLYPEI